MMTIRALTLVIGTLGLVLAAGCRSKAGGNKPPPRLEELPRALTAAEQGVIRASNHFAFGLLREVRKRDRADNVFLSPLSASMALGMTMNGAAGETLAQMRSTLGFGGLAPEEINESYRDLIDLLLTLDDSVDTRLANSLWVRDGFPLHDAFVQSSREHFDAEATSLDFNDPGAADTINAWVREHTDGKIDRLIGRIGPDVVLYLLNAVYFKGSWRTRFDPQLTREAPFYLDDETQQTVQMMSLSEGKLRFLFASDVEIVDLPYGRDAFCMTVVLPRGGRTLDELIASLDAATWSAWIDQLHEGELIVSLPRLRVEYESVLNETLQALGMNAAFDPVAADFAGLSPLGESLYISQVKQKTFVDVNEEGTEAAAATSVETTITSAPLQFEANRPFLVAIRERLSGTLLFLGAIGAPPRP